MVEQCFAETNAPKDDFVVLDCLAVGLQLQGGMDERVILFAKLPEARQMTQEFEDEIKSELRKRRSPRHVPAKVHLTCSASLLSANDGPINRSFKWKIYHKLSTASA